MYCGVRVSVCTQKALLGMPRARRQGGRMSASFGRFAGCHGHTEGDVPANRRWVQWHKQGAVPLPYAILSQHPHMEGSRACTHWLTQAHFILMCKTFHKRISTCLSYILGFFFLRPSYCLLFFKVNTSFFAVCEQIQYNAECVWLHTLGSILRTHCVSAVNSRSVSCISAVFGPILELTQETGPFWQPPCQPVLHTAAPEPSVAHTHIPVWCSLSLTHTDRPDFSMLTTYQCFIHLIDFHESFNFLFKSTRLLSSLCSIPDFHQLWLERPLTKAPRCVTWRAPRPSHLVFSIAHFKPCSTGAISLLSQLEGI